MIPSCIISGFFPTVPTELIGMIDIIYFHYLWNQVFVNLGNFLDIIISNIVMDHIRDTF